MTGRKIASFDTETFLFAPGQLAPPLVCASTAWLEGTSVKGRLIDSPAEAVAVFRRYLDDGYMLTFANAAYDLAVMAEADPTLLPVIFRALDEDRIFDILIAESLHGIFGGHLGKTESGGSLISPSTGRPSKRYSLEIVTSLVLGRSDAKSNDAWRKSYAILSGFPSALWPETARVYPVDDAVNTLEVALAQIFGRHGAHYVVAEGSGLRCKLCGDSALFNDECPVAERVGKRQNLDNLSAQVRAAFALHLGAAHGLRVDPQRLEKLRLEVEEKHRLSVERFQRLGWIRPDGTEDQVALKKAVALAFGARLPCSRCEGTGYVETPKFAKCRGSKERGRYSGCLGSICLVCRGTMVVQTGVDRKACKNVFDLAGNLDVQGCDGTGIYIFDEDVKLPKSDKQGVRTDRDTLLESGDDSLADFGENEFEKSRTTYIPYLATGTKRPLTYSPNVIVATGRCSYEGSPLHQMPRSGGERECIRARGAWCGYPVEMVLGSTDYEAGELCTLAQFTYWIFGQSQMRDVINSTGKPGILHSDLAAEVLGMPLEQFLVKLKAKDKQATDFRQMSKAINFGVPGGMGSTKLVLTSRKKNAGFTVVEGGPARNAKGQQGYWGVRFCVLTGRSTVCGIEKIDRFKRVPTLPVCKECVDIVENELRPAYFRRYPEVKEYFSWAQKEIEAHSPAPSYVWGGKEHVVSRRRGGIDFPAFCNNGFQSMLSDVGKLAFYNMTREAYLGVKADGSPSPLSGARFPLYLHDEPLSELVAETAHLSGPRIAELMMEAGRTLAPDVTWRAETAIAYRWSKSMEPVYVDGKLVPWDLESL